MDNNVLIYKMMEFNSADPLRIQHFIKVYTFARMIGEMEGIPEEKQFVLETAAIVHDIGIKPSLIKYGDSIGPHQEELGAVESRKMLTELGYDEKVVDRVSFLVGHHHTYDCIDDVDYQILVEADFLVNIFEDEKNNSVAKSVRERIFRTESGKKILDAMFTPDVPVEFKPKKLSH